MTTAERIAEIKARMKAEFVKTIESISGPTRIFLDDNALSDIGFLLSCVERLEKVAEASRDGLKANYGDWPMVQQEMEISREGGTDAEEVALYDALEELGGEEE
jgi:hypothetical protein